MQIEWLLVALGWVIGSFPSARLIGMVVGHDPTAEGSGNPGATNMLRIAGRRAGIATLVFDVAKALAATLIGRAADGTTLAVACGAAAVVGHVFPVMRASRGGKGVACFGGLTIGAWPVLALIGFATWIASAKVGRRSFYGALVACPVIALGTVILDRPTLEIVIVWVLVAVIVARHRSNIQQAFADRRSRPT